MPSLPGLELVANSGQDFNRWQRRVRPASLVIPNRTRAELTCSVTRQLITMRKTTAAHDDDADVIPGSVHADGPRLGHADFRNRYYSRFGDGQR